MRLAPLVSLVAIDDHGSFTAAASAIHLSHSAVSIQIRQLEQKIGAPLFDRSTRPPRLTPLGRDYVAKAREVLAKVGDLETIGTTDRVTGTIAFGLVPTTLQTILPKILRELGQKFPALHVTARSGPSNELADSVMKGRLDFAFLTAPEHLTDNMVLDEIAHEPLLLIAPPKADPALSARQLLNLYPYIAFSPQSWLGRQIEQQLKATKTLYDPVIELDSVNAVEHLVSEGFGVAVVPQRLFADDLSKRMHCLPFGSHRRLVLASSPHSNRSTLRRAILDVLQA